MLIACYADFRASVRHFRAISSFVRMSLVPHTPLRAATRHLATRWERSLANAAEGSYLPRHFFPQELQKSVIPWLDPSLSIIPACLRLLPVIPRLDRGNYCFLLVYIDPAVMPRDDR